MNQEIHSSKTSNGVPNMGDALARQTSLYCLVKTALQKTHTNNMGKSRFIHNTCIIDGIQFASEAESRRYLELKALKRTGEISEFELQPRYKLLEAFRKCPQCGNNQAHVPGTSKKSVVNCHNCGTKTEVIQGMEYVADFKLIYPDGTERIEDVKGTKKFMDEIFKHKRKWFNMLYPGKYIHIVVMPPVKKPRAAHKAINEKRRK